MIENLNCTPSKDLWADIIDSDGNLIECKSSNSKWTRGKIDIVISSITKYQNPKYIIFWYENNGYYKHQHTEELY